MLSSVRGCWWTQCERLIRHDLEMGWIDAGSHVAQVVDLEPLGDGPDVELVRESVRDHLSATDVELSVAVVRPLGIPDPAVACGQELRLETLDDARAAHSTHPSTSSTVSVTRSGTP
jgi:hypothetical protein